jgi:hypothetical protein
MNLLIIEFLAVVIVLEHSFYIFDKQRYLRDQQESVSSFRVALEQYIASPHVCAVREGVSAAVHAYEEAVTAAVPANQEAARTVVYTYEGKFRGWMAKLPFKCFKRKAGEAFECSQEQGQQALCSRAKAQLTKTILEITSNHRLRMFHCYVVVAIPLIRLSSARP